MTKETNKLAKKIVEKSLKMEEEKRRKSISRFKFPEKGIKPIPKVKPRKVVSKVGSVLSKKTRRIKISKKRKRLISKRELEMKEFERRKKMVGGL